MSAILKTALSLNTSLYSSFHNVHSVLTLAQYTLASSSSSLDHHEAAKFSALSSHWWDPNGPFAPLHRLNPARCQFIREAICSARSIDKGMPEPLSGMRVLDVGCGGGILAESMARMGAQVHAIDVTEENIVAARHHASLDPLSRLRIRHECITAEALAQRDDSYDLVLASEVIEHVRHPDQFIKTLSLLLQRPGAGSGAGSGGGGDRDGRGGTLIVSTMNRTAESLAVAIVGAEYLMRIVPRGTHEWHRFITPQELTLMAEQAQQQLEPQMMAGIGLTSGGLMQLTDHLGVNYIASFGFKPSA